MTVYISANVSALRSFLENNGADVRSVGEDYIEAYVPVTLLGQLSEQSGVARVETIFGPKEVGPLPLKPARPLLQPLAQATTDPCLTELGTLTGVVSETRTGSWSSSCTSDRRGERAARYYSFTVSQNSVVTIDLTAPNADSDGDPDTDTVLYLLVSDWTGDFITVNDDKAGEDTTNSQIRIGLTPGTYAVEATTFGREITGDFALEIAAATVSIPVDSHGATTWHQAGIKGQGVKVGVIDVGFDGFGALMGTELPATVHMRCYTDIGEFTPNVLDCEVDTAHGTAVAETIIDIAPDVELYIANPFSRADLRSATEWMISQGVQVINYSAAWIWDGPGDGTSTLSISPLNTVDAAVAGGILWVNAAGNEAENTYFEQSYHDENRSNGLVEFLKDDGTRAAFIGIRLYAFYPFLAQLRWDDHWGGASSDLDLYLYDINSNIVASSTDFQAGDPEHVPFEVLRYVPPDTGNYILEISNGNIPNLGRFQLQDFFGASYIQSKTLYGSIGNPADSANLGLLAAGAAPWGINSEIEPFSSRGPTPDGRTKPDLVGADRADTVAYGPAGFPGTSQGSPHVAGLAALVLQHFPAYTPAEVAQYLKDNAVQRTEPSPDNTDPNNIWGHGYAELPSVPNTPGGRPLPERLRTKMPSLSPG